MRVAVTARIGPYDVVSVLGRGGMGTVYRVRSPQGDDVALKLLTATTDGDPMSRLRFLREFRLLSALSHPNLVRVLQAGEHEGHPYYTMEWLTGRTLSEALPTPEPTPIRLLHHAMQICQGLAYIHRAGVVHRDLKPANIMITDQDQVRLTDFGLAREVSGTSDLTQSGTLMGTVFYMAPEQISGTTTDSRSDLYALGVLLYELAAGVRPFDKPDIMAALQEIMTVVPVPPRQRHPATPEPLSDLIMKLLQKDPDQRYQTADEVYSDLAALASTLQMAQPMGVASLAPQQIQLLPAPLLGRDKEAERLLEALDQVTRGTPPQFIVLRADAGMGKSRLAGELVRQARRKGFRTISEPSPPGRDRSYQFVRPLLRHLTEGRPPSPILDVVLRDDASVAAGADQYTVYEAVVQLVCDLAQQPVVVVLDGVDQADPDSLSLLRYLVQSVSSGGPLALLLLCLEEQKSDLCSALFTSVALGPLSRPEVLLLVARVLGGLPDEPPWVERLFSETGGNPGFVLKTLQWLLDERRLVRRSGDWHLEGDASSVVLAPAAEAVLSRRLAGVATPLLEVLRCLTLLQGETSYPRLKACCGLADDALLETLDRLLEQRFLEETREGRLLRFVEPSMMRLVAQGMSATRKAAWHAAIATGLESSEPSVPLLIAEHHDLAGQPEQALPWFRRAAEGALAVHAYQRAATIADALIPLLDQGLPSDGHVGPYRKLVLDALIGAGRAAEAGALASRWLAHATLATDRIPLLRRLAEARFEQGDASGALESLARVLDALGLHTLPADGVYLPVYRKMGLRTVAALLRGVFGYLPSVPPATEPATADLQEGVATMQLVPQTFQFLASKPPVKMMVAFFLRNLDVARRVPSLETTEMVYTIFLMVSTLMGWPGKSRIRHQCEDFVLHAPPSEATYNLRFILGLTAFRMGRFTEARRWATEALEQARQQDLMRRVGMAGFWTAVSALFQGDVAAATEVSRQAAHTCLMLEERAYHRLNQALLYLLQGHAEGIVELIGTTDSTDTATVRFLSGLAWYLKGRSDQALPCFVANLGFSPMDVYHFYGWDSVLASLCCAGPEAPAYLRQAQRLHRHHPGVRHLLEASRLRRAGKSTEAERVA